MSTICKLDPRVRKARSERAHAIRSLGRALPFIKPERYGAAAILHGTLDNVRRAPYLTGAEKEVVFANLMRSLMPAATGVQP